MFLIENNIFCMFFYLNYGHAGKNYTRRSSRSPVDVESGHFTAL